MARQVTADSAVELACHPLRCGQNLVVEGAEHLTACGFGVLVKRLCLNRCCRPGPVCPYAADENHYCPAHFELYADANAALEALHQTICQATERIDVLMFLWDNDPLGSAVAEWLTARAAAGVHVRILIDGGGNLVFSPVEKGVDVNAVLCALARQPNVEVVRIRNPFFRFDHRKLVLADGCLAWTGGRNFTHKSFFAQHDLSFAIRGPLVDDLQACFNDSWREQGGGCSAECGARSAEPESCAPANAWVRTVHTGPEGHRLAPELYRAVEQAKETIYLENGYLSDPRLVCRLIEARERGVDVRVVLTVSAKEAVVDCANRVTANRLLRGGVRVYICPEMTHVKAGIVDGCWAYLGTGNYDALSLRHNCEFGLVIGAGPLIGELEEHLFAPDCCAAWELHEPYPVTWMDYLGEAVMCLLL
jgi:cardiolipin synthase